MISTLAERGEVKNALIFVSDSHRFDSLPDSVARLGTTFEGISASTFTASGLPSILNGQLPSSHRVWTSKSD